MFDYKQKLFDDCTGLEFFTEQNPLALLEGELAVYRELRAFETGLFDIRSIERGKGVLLVSIASGAERFVHDVNASLSLRGNETVWTRIAPVGGLYHGVGSIFFALPLHVKERMREAIRGWKRNEFDAKWVASWAVGPKESTPAPPPSYEESSCRFERALKKCGMDGFFSLETFAEWVSNEKKYDPLFAARALECLTPEDVPFNDSQELILAADFGNNISRVALGGKTPNEALRERQQTGDPGDWETDMFSKEKYMKTLAEAHEQMKAGAFQKSYKAFEQVIKDLYKDKLPFAGVFRVYANAAVCCFHMGRGNEMLGEALLDASLRLNPLYEFAKRQKERYVVSHNFTHEEGFASLPKKGQKMLQDMRDEMCKTGKRMYQHRVFSKYEKFLKELGVSLAYNARVERTIFSFGEDGKPVKSPKIGRNDPCPCESGKKFKKCCGR